MKIISTLTLLLLITFSSNAQNFNGQWKGGFIDNTSILSGLGSGNIDYVLEIECTGSEVSGYSYTYFSEGTKQYYTICKLKGSLNRAAKEIMVTEIERTKFNTPPDFRNCFQSHLLKYSKLNSDSEQLSGTWIPAPNQAGDCGKGRTILYRKIFKKDPDIIVSVPPKKIPPVKLLINKKPVGRPVAVSKNKKNNIVAKKTLPQKIKDSVIQHAIIPPPKILSEKPSTFNGKYEPRIKSLIKTLDIHNDTINVDFYDNGAVDGDSITVFFNGKIIVKHLGLTEKAASFKLLIDKTLPYNELIMYAENMGTIPPNTALMVVKDGTKQYEVDITSDTERSGTIRFHYVTNP